MLDRIVAEHNAGEGLSAIARILNAEGIPTARGGAEWYRSTVRAALRSADLDREAAEAAASGAAE